MSYEYQILNQLLEPGQYFIDEKTIYSSTFKIRYFY